MARYEADIDLENPNISHTQVIDLVGFDQTVLDVGCATGDVARVLNSHGCRVSGVELDAEAAELARPDLEELVIADLNTSPLSDHFKAGSFDVIIFADVLECLNDPRAVLKDSLALLSREGRVVISIPNVAHGSLRLALLQGCWNYTETGLLDSTHVRFFTKQTFVELMEDSGLAIDEFRSTVADPLNVEVEVDPIRLPSTIVEWVRDQPESMSYQFVVSARPVLPGEEAPPCPRLVPAVRADIVRMEDHHTLRMREERDLQHRLLTMRDHIIGLEASVAAAQHRQAIAQREAALAKRRAKAARERARAATERARQIRRMARRRENEIMQSSTWRIGRAVTKPLRALRRKAR